VRAHVRVFLLALGLFSGCATNGGDTPAVQYAFDSRTLVYDTLVLEFESSGAAVENVRIEGAGDAAVEGLKMMLAAPLGCLGGGIGAPLCLAAAPFFPAWLAIRSQEPAISRREMQALAEFLDTTRFDERLQASVAEQAALAALPVRDAANAVGRIVRLRLELAPMEFHHSGYKNGSIDVIQRYLFQLLGPDGAILTELRGRQHSNYDVDDWSLEDAAELRSSLDEWIAHIADGGIRLLTPGPDCP